MGARAAILAAVTGAVAAVAYGSTLSLVAGRSVGAGAIRWAVGAVLLFFGVTDAVAAVGAGLAALVVLADFTLRASAVLGACPAVLSQVGVAGAIAACGGGVGADTFDARLCRTTGTIAGTVGAVLSLVRVAGLVVAEVVARWAGTHTLLKGEGCFSNRLAGSALSTAVVVAAFTVAKG